MAYCSTPEDATGANLSRMQLECGRQTSCIGQRNIALSQFDHTLELLLKLYELRVLRTALGSRAGRLTSMHSLEGLVYFLPTRCSAQATKSTNVFFLCRYLPSSYHRRPISPPPRACAMAKTKPRSTKDSRFELKYGSLQTS